jgi:hypothetical protein
LPTVNPGGSFFRMEEILLAQIATLEEARNSLPADDTPELADLRAALVEEELVRVAWVAERVWWGRQAGS